MIDIKNSLKAVQENVSLAKYTSFRIGGAARYFYAAKTALEIKQAVQVAKEQKMFYHIIGAGNNILVSDQGFNGLIIRVNNQEITIEDNEISAGAGVMLANLVGEAANASLAGLEWLAGIPGTVGGAIYGNAGAFGGSMGEKIEKVEVLNPDDLKVKWLRREECEFNYRTSIFLFKADQPLSAKKNKYIILSAILKLEKGDSQEIRSLIKEYIKKRGHHPTGFPSAGSVFKNISIAENQKIFNGLRKKFPETDKFKTSGKIPVGWLVEELGLRGKKIGGAMISEEHGNFIINTGGATAENVITLISLIKQKIRVNFGIQLEEEIQYLGF